MKNSIILMVASKDEEELLIPKGLENEFNIYTVITGYGMGNVINAYKEFDPECTVINIGFVGAPIHIENRLYSIGTSILGPNEHAFNRQFNLKTIDSIPTLPCITVADFETNPNRFYPKTCYSKDYVIDMELYAIASYFDNVYSIKIPSDNGNLKDYFSQKDKKKELQRVRNVVSDLIQEILDN